MSREACGLLLVDKPRGPTSFAAVARVRWLLHEKRVGHAGTLDPLATGLLPILVGEGTKLVPFLMGLDKEYEATVRFGVATDTYDAEGRVTATVDASALTEGAIGDALGAFVGRIAQRPPAYSAIKRDGKRLYELARSGEAVVVDEREVEIHAIDLLGFAPPDATLRVRCGKGTYIRSLAHDLGARLAMGAHLSALRRTRIGPLAVTDATDVFADTPIPPLRPLAEAVAHLPACAIDEPTRDQLRRGQQRALATLALPRDATYVRLLESNALVAIAERSEAGWTLARVFGNDP